MSVQLYVHVNVNDPPRPLSVADVTPARQAGSVPAPTLAAAPSSPSPQPALRSLPGTASERNPPRSGTPNDSRRVSGVRLQRPPRSRPLPPRFCHESSRNSRQSMPEARKWPARAGRSRDRPRAGGLRLSGGRRRRVGPCPRPTSSTPCAPRSGRRGGGLSQVHPADLGRSRPDGAHGAHRGRPGRRRRRRVRLRRHDRPAGRRHRPHLLAGGRAARARAGHHRRPPVRLVAAGRPLRGPGGDERDQRTSSSPAACRT